VQVAKHFLTLSTSPSIVNGLCSSRNFFLSCAGGKRWFSRGPRHEHHAHARVDS
jgi:hypothetical protein